MNEQNNSALVPRPSSAIERVQPGPKRILSGMLADALKLARKRTEDRDFRNEQVGIAAANELARFILKAAEEGLEETEVNQRKLLGLRLRASLRLPD